MKRNDRRFFERLPAHTIAAIYTGNKEYPAIMEDISETGCKLKIQGDNIEIEKDMVVSIVATDDYVLFGKKKHVVITEKAVIVWIDGNTAGCKYVGRAGGAYKYAEEKKIEAFIKKHGLLKPEA